MRTRKQELELIAKALFEEAKAYTNACGVLTSGTKSSIRELANIYNEIDNMEND
jgi:hypothetical protein